MQLWMNLTRNKPDFESAIIASGYGIIRGVINPIYKADDVRSKLTGQYTYLEPLAETNPLNLGEIIKFKIDAISPLKFQGFGFVFDADSVGIAIFSQLKRNFSCQFGAYYSKEGDWTSPRFFMSINAMFEAGVDYVFLNPSFLPEIIEWVIKIHDRMLYKTRVILESDEGSSDDVLASGAHGLLLKDYEYVNFFGKV
jgi:hypothetical protein